MEGAMKASFAVWVGVLAVALVGLGPLLAVTGLLVGLPAFALFALGAPVGFAAVVAGGITVLRRRPAPGVLAIALGLATMCAVILASLVHAGAPPLNDVTTDLEQPPAFRHAATLPALAGKDLSYPEAFKAPVREHYRALTPLLLPLGPAEALALAEQAARAQPGWEVTAVDAGAGTVEAVVRTRLFRFEDDVVVRVRAEGEGSRVDVRSRSRVGRGDLGANARRIEGFLRALAARAPGVLAFLPPARG
jgi:uncharacterized protein (DUF1499 family)